MLKVQDRNAIKVSDLNLKNDRKFSYIHEFSL